MRGVFLDTATIDPGDLDLDALTSSIPEWSLHRMTDRGDTAATIGDADIVVSNKVMLDGHTLRTASSLKLVCIAATGTNNVDLETARQRGITVCNARGYATTSVVEHVFALMLSLRRRLPEQQRAARDGRWQDSDAFCLLDFPFSELAGQTLGIIGYGELGRAVAGMGKAFGMRVCIAGRPDAAPATGHIPIRQLQAEADVISLHCPLTEATRNLIDAEAFARMRSSCLLINTARGGIVDEADLLDALQSGQIAGAATDVLSVEPPRKGNVLLHSTLPNLIITPHVAWASTRARQRLIDEVTANIQAYLGGRPRNVVVPG